MTLIQQCSFVLLPFFLILLSSHLNRVNLTVSAYISVSRNLKNALLTLSRVYAYMTRELLTSHVTPQEMGKVWNFTRVTPLLHQVCAKHPISHIATLQQALNTPGACQAPHIHIANTLCRAQQLQVPVIHT